MPQRRYTSCHNTVNLPYRFLPTEFNPKKGRPYPQNRTRVHRTFICTVNEGIFSALKDVHSIVGVLERFSFRLYYTSHRDDRQTVDVYIEDSMDLVVQRSFSFWNENVADEQRTF